MQAKTIKDAIALLSIPLFFLIVFLTFWALWILLGLPQREELVPIIREYFDRYGLWMVFAAALIEGVFIMGQYFPGGFIIFLGVIAAGGNIPNAIGVVAAVSCAFVISYTINYLLGKYGWYRLLMKFGFKHSLDQAKEKLERHEFMAVVSSYWDPNLASLTATAAGILQLPLRRFTILSLFSIIIWNSFWGIIVFFAGEAVLQFAGFTFVLAAFLLWASIILIYHYVLQPYWHKRTALLSHGR